MATDLELSEQTPLKSDTDAPVVVVSGAESTAEGAPAAPAGEKKKWFFTKKNKATKTEEGSAQVAPTKDAEGGAVPATGNDNKKKNHWWQCKQAGKPTGEGADEDQQQQLSCGINMVQRDDNNLQTGIDMGYDQIYGEPDSVHSINNVWKYNHAVFTGVRSFFYKVFSLIIAIPLAIIFGVLFALVSALSVFVCVPAGVLLSIPIGWVFKAWNVVVRSVFDPIFHAIGLSLSNVKVSRYGLNTDPTACMTA